MGIVKPTINPELPMNEWHTPLQLSACLDQPKPNTDNSMLVAMYSLILFIPTACCAARTVALNWCYALCIGFSIPHQLVSKVPFEVQLAWQVWHCSSQSLLQAPYQTW